MVAIFIVALLEPACNVWGLFWGYLEYRRIHLKKRNTGKDTRHR